MVDDVLTYALFPQVGLKFLKNRHNPDAFEPAPDNSEAPVAPAPVSVPAQGGVEQYSVKVDGQIFDVEVGPRGQITSVQAAAPAAAKPVVSAPAASAEPVLAPLAGTIFKVNVASGAQVNEGDVVIVLEAMKMETEIRAAKSGSVAEILVKEGDSVSVGSPLLSLA